MPDARFPGEPRDSCGSCYVDGLEGLLPALHIETHGVYDALDSHHSSGNGAIIVDVGMDRLNAELNVGEKLCSALWMPRCAPACADPPLDDLEIEGDEISAVLATGKRHHLGVPP
jgi:hypothetical protein